MSSNQAECSSTRLLSLHLLLPRCLMSHCHCLLCDIIPYARWTISFTISVSVAMHMPGSPCLSVCAQRRRSAGHRYDRQSIPLLPFFAHSPCKHLILTHCSIWASLSFFSSSYSAASPLLCSDSLFIPSCHSLQRVIYLERVQKIN